jgi:hypothetical protein
MRSERGHSAAAEEPKRRAPRKKKEATVEMEGLVDASALEEAGVNDNGDSAEIIELRPSGGDDAASLERKIDDMNRQKEVNLKNPALSESMAAKINAEIDKNVAELQARAATGKKSGRGKSRGKSAMAERVDERMALDDESEAALAEFRAKLEKKREEVKGDDEDVVTSAPPLDKLVSKATLEKKPPTREEVAEGVKKMREEREAGFAMLEKKILDKERQEKEEQARAAAEKETEDAFFARGEQIDTAHEGGDELVATETEMAGQRKQDRFEGRSRDQELLAERVGLLQEEIPRIQNALTASERRLHREFGIADAEEESMKRTGAWESAKSFFGGLFSKKEKMKSAAIEDYRRLRDRLGDREAELNEAQNRLNRPEDVRRAQQLKGERRGGR